MQFYWRAIPGGVDPALIDLGAVDAALRAAGVDMDGVSITTVDAGGDAIPPSVLVTAAADPGVALDGLDWTVLQRAE